MIERLSRSVVLRRNLPEDVGGAQVYVTPDAALRYWRPSLASVDPPLLEAAIELVAPGAVVWDVGASVGLFAFAAAGLAVGGCVLAVEPDPLCARLLRRSAAALSASHARVAVLEAAASRSAGAVQLMVASRGRSSSHLGDGRSEAGGVRMHLLVPSVTLDSLLGAFSAPTVLKIDVEGHELPVLEGAEKVLSQHRPVVLCEVGLGSEREAVAALFHRHRYRLFNAAERPPRRAWPGASWSTLAIPA